MEAGGEDLFGLAQSQAGSGSNPGPNTEAFNGALGGGEVVDFGAGYQIPLDEFLEFGEAGVVQSRSTATDGRNGEAITGIAGADGGLTLDGTDGEFGTARIDLLSILKASGTSGVTDEMIDEAELNFGLGGAWVEAIDGEFQDPDAVGEYGQYRVGDLNLQLHSPAIDAAGDGLSDAAGQMEQQVTDTINESLDLGSALPIPGLSVETEVTSTLQQDVLDATLLGPIATDDGLAEIDLGEGTVKVDLGRIGGNDDGVIDRPVGLNNQNPNTELIDDETYPFVASSVHDVIEEVIDLSVGTAMDSLESVSINSAVTAPDGTTASWDMTLNGEVSNFECTAAGLTGVATCASLEGAMGLLGPVMEPINEALSNPEGVLYQAFTTIKTDLMTVPVRAAVDPFLELIAAGLFSVQINHQTTQTCEMPDGSEVPSGLEVSALSVGVLGGAARLGIGNAGVRVDACDLAAATPVLDASSPAPAGGETTLDSDGWAPDTDVAVQLTDPEGNPVGDPITVTTDENGAFPEGTVLPIPEDATPGDGFTITATDPEGNEATDTLEIAPADDSAEISFDASSPAPAGGESTLESDGWAPGTDVTVQLTDPEGNALGDPITVTTDENGAFPEGTVLPIPEDATPGDGFTITATDPEGNEATDTLEVVEAGTPVVDASSPVAPGGESTLDSQGWAPDTDVAVQLTDPEGNPVGDPITVTTDENGAFPEGSVLPIPEDATPGDGFTITATDPEGNEATDTLEVAPADAPSEVTLDASSPVPAGGESTLDSDGWAPNTDVAVQLTDPEGNPVGDPITVTTDENGAFPEGTVLPIPEDATPGDGFTITATDPEGNEATDTLEVVEAGTPVVDASSPVAPGECSEIASSGWAPETDVSFQLTDADGTPVGDPISVTTDAEGKVSADTCVDVPEGTEPGDYTIIATDPDGNEATDTLEVAPADAPGEVSFDASSPVPAGGESTLDSDGWAPDTDVAVQLTDPEGNPVGDPITVTTDENGAFPEGSVLPIPEDATPGDGFTITATDPEGNEATDTLEVVEAGTPVVDASSPVPAGGESTLDSQGWAPGTDVTVQLTDPEGNALGDPITVTTDENGAFPEGAVLPIPEDATPGDGFTITATDPEGNEATDTLEIAPADDSAEVTLEATSPVRAGDQSILESAGWTPGTDVAVQLTDPEGDAVGDPISVTTDENGAFPEGTALPVSSEATAREGYTVTATDPDGIEATATIEVVAADAELISLDASSPAPAGGESTLESAGWAPGTEVAVQLTDPEGNAVGDPITVTADESGAFPEGAVLPIPEDATPGDGFTVTATDPEGNEATDNLEVTAAGGTCVADQSVTIEPDSVEAGGTVTITGAGFAPGTATVAITDADGNQVGDVLETEVGEDCAFENEATVSVEVTPGEYEIVVTDNEGNSASDVITVTEATSGGDPAPGGDDDSSIGDDTGNGDGTGNGDDTSNGGDTGNGDGTSNGGDTGNGGGTGNGDESSNDDSSAGAGEGHDGSGSGAGVGGDLPRTGSELMPVAALASLLSLAGAVALVARHQRKV